MKKLYTLALAITTCASFAQASDSFTGTGALNANGWTTHSGATPGQLTIMPGSLSYAGLTTQGGHTQLIAGNSEDVNLPSAAPITGNAYFSSVVNVMNTDGLAPNTDTAGHHFLMMGSTAGATGVTILVGRLYVRAGSLENTFNLGVLNGAGGTATPTWTGADYPVGTPVFAVVKYDLAGNTASLFVNPAIGSTEGTPTATNNTGTSPAPAQVASMIIRQAGNATAGSGNIQVDEIRLGTTWEYVTSGSLRNNQNAIAGLQVYPNPVTAGNLFITTDNNNTKNVVVYDILGKVVVKATVNEQPVNVSNLKSGVYVVKITEDGKTATRKLVIRQ